MDEAIAHATKDFTQCPQWKNFEVSYVEPFDGGSHDEVDEDGNIIHCWNVFYFVDGERGSYDGVGMIYAKSEEEAIEIQRKDFVEKDGLDLSLEFEIVPF